MKSPQAVFDKKYETKKLPNLANVRIGELLCCEVLWGDCFLSQCHMLAHNFIRSAFGQQNELTTFFI